jgi:hypothetical protein
VKASSLTSISIEYCHVTPEITWEDVIATVNEDTSRLLRSFNDLSLQKCIMIDDLHSQIEISSTFISKLIDSLEVKPDTIYLESSFVFLAAKIDSLISKKQISFKNTAEKRWLKKIHDTYGSNNEFLYSWRKYDGAIGFSCPTLVATSYLYRLGVFGDDNIEPIWGEQIRTGDHLLGALSSIYLQVEANAQTIIQAVNPELLKKLRWHFTYQ